MCMQIVGARVCIFVRVYVCVGVCGLVKNKPPVESGRSEKNSEHLYLYGIRPGPPLTC